MEKALGAIGPRMLLQIVAALTLAITGELTAQRNASKTVGSHPKYCKCCIESSRGKLGNPFSFSR